MEFFYLGRKHARSGEVVRHTLDNDARCSVCRTIFVTVQRDYIVGGQSMESSLQAGENRARLQLRNNRNRVRQITNVPTTPGCMKKQLRQSGADHE